MLQTPSIRRLFTKWKKMCNKNKIHMVLTPVRYQLNFQRLFAWIILLFISLQ